MRISTKTQQNKIALRDARLITADQVRDHGANHGCGTVTLLLFPTRLTGSVGSVVHRRHLSLGTVSHHLPFRPEMQLIGGSDTRPAKHGPCMQHEIRGKQPARLGLAAPALTH